MVFTSDLRVNDNPALAAAARSAEVVPLFVFDEVILRRHQQNATRLAFLLGSLRDLEERLLARGGRLIIRRGPWAPTVLDLAVRAGAEQIHLMQDVSGYARRRLARLRSLCRDARREVVAHPASWRQDPRRSARRAVAPTRSSRPITAGGCAAQRRAGQPPRRPAHGSA